MLKEELITRSPLRILEKSIHGGVGVGNIGLITSRHGVGKTACLVHIAIDKLFQGRHVIHLSFSEKTDHIIRWYETLFQAIAKKRQLEDAIELHDDLVKNRVIMNFNQSGVSIDQILRSITALITDGHFNADVLVIDGYNFTEQSLHMVKSLRDFAQEHKLTIWATADSESHNRIPDHLRSLESEIAVHIHLQNQGQYIELSLVKDHDFKVEEHLHLKLEAGTLLISDT